MDGCAMQKDIGKGKPLRQPYNDHTVEWTRMQGGASLQAPLNRPAYHARILKLIPMSDESEVHSRARTKVTQSYANVRHNACIARPRHSLRSRHDRAMGCHALGKSSFRMESYDGTAIATR